LCFRRVNLGQEQQVRVTAFFILFGFTVLSASATSVYNFSSAPTATDTTLSFGFQFSTNTAITVASLGYFDDGGDGFASVHRVGIFDSDGDLLASTTLGTGTTDPLVGQFRFQSITPILLAAGQTYTLAATTGGSADPWAYGDAGTTLADFTVDPRISIAQDAARFLYQSDNHLRNPTEHFAYTLYAGPSFEIGSGITATPEPDTGAVLGGLGVLAGVLFTWKRRVRRKA
jgi:hypothetical protein